MSSEKVKVYVSFTVSGRGEFMVSKQLADGVLKAQAARRRFDMAALLESDAVFMEYVRAADVDIDDFEVIDEKTSEAPR